jgi:hypothetical protein
MGRPTTYTPDLVAAVLDYLEDGLCVSEIAAIDGMPKVRTIYQWQDVHPEFAQEYARAHDAGVRNNEAELLRVARRKPADAVEATAQRTLVDTLKWRLSKRLPRDFGDRQAVDLNGKVTLDSVIAETLAKNAPPKAD